MINFENKYVFGILSAIVISIILSLLFLGGAFESMSLRASDVLYEERLPLNNLVIVAIDDKSLQEIGRWPWDRSAYVSFLDKTSEAKVVGFDISFFEKSKDDEAFADAISNHGKVILAAEYQKFSDTGRGELLLKPVFRTDYGHVNLYQDVDGVVRSLPLNVEGEENTKSFSAVVAEKFLGDKITDEAKGKRLINYIGKPGTFHTVSYSDVSKISKEDFKNKIVLVGATSPDLHDERLTPSSYSKPMSGVEVHANAVQMLVTNMGIQRQGSESVILVIFIMALISGLLVARLKIIFAGMGIIGMGLVYIYISTVIFGAGILMNIFFPLLTLGIVYVANYVFLYHSESKRKKQITNIFGRYVSKEVVNEILKKTKSDQIDLGGHKKEITILFSDIRGFTSISEKMSPEELIEFLNEYFTEMSKVIMDNRGIVDKYIGDAIMAFWGAPLDEKQHAKFACEAALGMKEKLPTLKEKIGIGIGLNTGEAVVGNVGSKERINYTVIGDSVNTASRLEGLNKAYGTQIIVSESTMKEAGDSFMFRELDTIKVKGKTKPTRIFELLCKIDQLKEDDKKIMASFSRGLELYKKQKWKEAIEEFNNALKIKPDGPSLIFIERCKHLSKEKLPKDWDGVFEMKTK